MMKPRTYIHIGVGPRSFPRPKPRSPPEDGGQSPLEGTSRQGRGLARLKGPHKKVGNKEPLPKQGWRALENPSFCLSPHTTWSSTGNYEAPGNKWKRNPEQERETRWQDPGSRQASSEYRRPCVPLTGWQWSQVSGELGGEGGTEGEESHRKCA